MSLIALLLIAFLITLLAAKSNKAGPAVLFGVMTVCLLFAAVPALGPAVSEGTSQFATELGRAADRAANVPSAEQEAQR